MLVINGLLTHNDILSKICKLTGCHHTMIIFLRKETSLPGFGGGGGGETGEFL